ncbi:MAG TPA: sugar ABC transporter substrate-binding protein, partial [Solirubrobacterales bacterium]|nr:sugar ABC transporter substrate-binding protein [Solirubrobacterales bacterium]
AMFAAGGLIALSVLVAACGGGSSTTGGGGGGEGGGGGTIALLLPESKTSRYEAHDRPEFEEKVEEMCPECEILYSNANQSTSEQQSQGEAAITQGANVLVLDAVDATAVGSVVAKANEEGIPVVSYDRLILGSPIDYYVSFDNEHVGELQAEALSRKLKEEGSPKGPIVMINGSPTDPNAGQFKAGAQKIFEKEGIEAAKEYDTPDWSPDQAQNEMEQAITSLGKNGFAAVYAANDGTAGGAIAAMKGAGIEPKSKPTTGQDAELEAIQRILAEEQFMTVYKAITPEAEAAAEIAVALAQGEKVPSGLVNGKTDNEAEEVESVLLEPVAVEKNNINETIVKDEFWPVSEICTGPYKADCKEAGIE